MNDTAANNIAIELRRIRKAQEDQAQYLAQIAAALSRLANKP